MCAPYGGGRREQRRARRRARVYRVSAGDADQIIQTDQYMYYMYNYKPQIPANPTALETRDEFSIWLTFPRCSALRDVFTQLSEH